jgi:hypothetical protein
MHGWRVFWVAVVVIELATLTLVSFRFVPVFELMVRDFAAEPPPLFRLVVAPAYPWAVGLGLVVLTFAADRMPRDDKTRVAALAAVAVAGAIVVGGTLYALYEPIFALAGRIQ